MMKPTWAVFQLVLHFSAAIFLSVQGADWAPNIQILEIIQTTDNKTEEVKRLKISKNSEIIVGEDVHRSSRLLIKCNATFPVQFIYIGAGVSVGVLKQFFLQKVFRVYNLKYVFCCLSEARVHNFYKCSMES